MEIDKIIEKQNLNIDRLKIYYNEQMSKHTSFKIGGPADCYIKIHNINDLEIALKFAEENKIPVTILGNGTNMLVSDKGIRGIVLKIDLKEIVIENTTYVKLGAGYKIAMLSNVFLENELTGFEELSGIPGTIGGAVKMNAGANGKEMKDIVSNVKCIDYLGNKKEFKNNEIEFGYRKSIFMKEEYIIYEIGLKLQKGKKEEIEEKIKSYFKERKEKQPLEFPSAGSTFKRGNDFITAKLIDEAGLKGYKIGGAMVSTKHAGFIINNGNATAKDVLKLTNYVKTKVYQKFGKQIDLEIELVGEW